MKKQLSCFLFNTRSNTSSNWTLLGVLFFIILSSCSEEKNIPLSDDKLAIVLRDVHIAETAVQHLRTADKDSLLNLYYQQVCTIHEIEREDLDSSIAILKRHPEWAHPQYEKVFEELEKLNLQRK